MAQKKVTTTTTNKKTTAKVAAPVKGKAPAKKGAKKATPAKAKKPEKEKKKGLVATIVDGAKKFKEDHPILDGAAKVIAIGAALKGAHTLGFFKGAQTKYEEVTETTETTTSTTTEEHQEEQND